MTRRRARPVVALWALALAASLGAQPTPGRDDAVVLVSIDGFRADYLDRGLTPTLDRLAGRGLRADGLVSVFPSLTFPSHYSIATGRYPARHGITGNQFFDPERDATFDYRDRETAADGSWWGGEPIWVTAERQRVATAAFFFPGTDVRIAGHRPGRWRAYDGRVPHETRVGTVLEWLALPMADRPRLITTYFSLVDTAGHRQGPDHPSVDESLRRADALLARLVDGIEALAHGDRVTLIVLSDHGMASSDPTRSLVLPEILDLGDVRVVPLGPGATLHVADPDRAAALRDAFNARVDPAHARAYLRDGAPAHLRTGGQPRFGDVVLVPSVGTWIALRAGASPPAGGHGWDPAAPAMHGIFVARGPRIPSGRRIAAIESIHVHPLVAALLNIEPADGIDGDLEALGALLTR